MFGLGAVNGGERNGLIKGSEATTMCNRQRWKVDVGYLLRAEQSLAVDDLLAQQADRARPELMAGGAGSLNWISRSSQALARSWST